MSAIASAYPKEVTLRDGTKVTVRPMLRDDGETLLRFFLDVPEKERFFFKEDVTSPRVIDEWIEHLDYRRALPLLAFANGRVVADAVLIRQRGGARSHDDRKKGKTLAHRRRTTARWGGILL